VKLGADDPGPLDRAFLGPQPLRSDIRISRWSPPGQKPLLFVEIVWRTSDLTAVFGAFSNPRMIMKPVIDSSAG